MASKYIVADLKPPPMKQFLLLVVFIFSCIVSKAQDYRFSQFYNSPLNLNPALTGKVDASFRVAFNYRNQWFNVADKPYITYAGSFDAPILLKKDALGIGLQIVNDRTNNGIYNHIVINASFAYHKAIGKKHSLTLGLQGGYSQRNLDRNNLRFFNQIDGSNGFNNNLPTGETDIATNSGYFDMGIGLLGNFRFGEKVNTYVGGALAHVLQPKEQFLGGGEYELKRKYTAHAGLEYRASSLIRVLPSVIYLNQAKMSELNLGLSLGFDVMEKVVLYGGGYYRLTNKLNGGFGASDAVIAYTAFEFQPIRLGFSYDVTLSPLINTPNSTGSFEVSLIITPRLANSKLPDLLLFCPRF
ncbi:MAG: PorP/SprF family type IX secretion system membrane protein [Chitinophagales bacterium]|nr:PorP/SprF family type IX secretion system membrane protein [Chitinophagales bacterium]